MPGLRLSSLLIPLFLFAAALVPRLLIVAQPIPVQLDRTLPDDAYYYFLTARNVADGRGASVDGLHESNGWHPLWLLVTTAVFAPDYADLDTPVRLALALGAVCDSLVAVVLYALVAGRVGRSPEGAGMPVPSASPTAHTGAGVVAGLAYALNAMPILQAVNGLETGLAALCVALAGMATVRLISAPSWGRALAWGAAFGVAFLARTDTALILVPLGVWAAWALVFGGASTGSLARRVAPIVAGALVALAVIAPFLAWNAVNFGSPLEQSSSGAVPYAARVRWTAANPDAPLWRMSWEVISHPTYWLRGDYFGTPPLVGVVLWAVAAVGVWRAGRRARPLARLTLAFVAGGAALLLVHTLVRYYPRPWYFVVMAQALALALGLFWATAGGRARLAALALCLPLLLVSGWFMWESGLYRWQSGLQYAGALWVRENTPPEARIAAMNSGIIGYYGGRDTVNLDGVVNPAALDAIRAVRLLPFMRAAGVAYFVDVDYAIEGEYGVFMGDGFPATLREVARIGEPYPGLGYIRAYALDQSG